MFYDGYSLQNWIMFFIVLAIIVAFIMYIAGLTTTSSTGKNQGMISQSGTSKSTAGGTSPS